MGTSRLRSGITRVLGLAALVLGALAIAGDPYGGHRVTLDTRELAAIVEAEVDHVTASELADWIIQGQTDYRLIDLRDQPSYAEYHIPTAEHVPLGQLVDHPLLRNERIVLYSDGGIHSAQAWFLLKAERYPGAYILLGGLDAWMDEVLFPALPPQPSAEELARFEEIRFVSEYFGGAPQSGGEESVAREPVNLPRVEMPSTSTVPTRKKKRKKEGC